MAGDPENPGMENVRDGIIGVKHAHKTAVIQPETEAAGFFKEQTTYLPKHF